MVSLTLQSSRNIGRALVVGNAACRQAVLRTLARDGQPAFETDCPYQAMAELARNAQNYRMVILSLQSLYREELGIIVAIKTHYPDVDIWLSQTDGRASALADALRLGADGIVANNGLHRLATSAEVMPEPPAEPARENSEPPKEHEFAVTGSDEPVLTADELRALLQEPPA